MAREQQLVFLQKIKIKDKRTHTIEGNDDDGCKIFSNMRTGRDK